MGLLDLFIAATIPVVKVLLITALGSFLATDRIDILGEDARKHLNNIVFYVFNPALVATNLSKTVTYESMVQLWFMPFNIFFTFLIGSALGWIVFHLTKAPEHLRGLIVGCCAAGNLGNMLFIIIPAVCKEKGSPFGAPDVCHTYGMAYSSLSMAIGAIYLWTYVYNIVRISSTKGAKELEINGVSISTPCKDVTISNPVTEPLLHSGEVSRAEDRANQLVLPYTKSDVESEVNVSKNVKHHFRIWMERINLKTVFAPSTIGAIIGFIVGLVPQIRKLMIGDRAPLRVIQDSAYLVGDGAIPALTIIMGGNLLKGLRGPGMQKSVIVGIIAARYVALPLFGVLIVKGAVRFGFVNPDPLYQFILLLQFVVPPAMNIGTITQLFGSGESECSVIMLWTYTFASISLTAWSTFFMWLVA